MSTKLAAPFNFLQKQCSKVLLCAGVIGTTALATVPAAEAKNHHHHNHRNQHELRQLRRDIRHDTRVYRHARKAHHREVNRYPRLMPAYGYGPGDVYGTPSGFGVQLRF
ncbi:hypothetical protein [Synechococcus sp. UW179A]|uniref:hypothetical protein n=1 Tax=Synechococcus sp. UW179A TaxID=2575510 RepID=UPI000E0FAFFC|nr:hypothetical protein [Synechococcus sp. UW179A]